jgi:exopolyphosphatase / guanosine-5'-triphosphate,3'-diphosphate pyrophosphatase
MRLASQMDEDTAHSEHVAQLALQLFDATADVHGLGDDSREVLEAAALLANVGLFVSHAGHHKHSYYVIRNSELLTGFTDREIELIALVARYHRKSVPRKKHPEFGALSREDQRRVRVLAGLLRVAVGLDRNHVGRVSGVTVRSDDRALVVAATPSDGQDVSLELHAAATRSELMADALGAPVEVVEDGRAAPTPPTAVPA